MPYLQPFYGAIGPQSQTHPQQDDKHENLPSFLASVLQTPKQGRTQTESNALAAVPHTPSQFAAQHTNQLANTPPHPAQLFCPIQPALDSQAAVTGPNQPNGVAYGISAKQAHDLTQPTGNRCGHNPLTPRLSLTRPTATGPGGLPRILTLAQERAEEFFHSPRKYQRFFGVIGVRDGGASGGLRDGCSPSLKNPSPATRGVASGYGVGENNQYAALQQGSALNSRPNTPQIHAETGQASKPSSYPPGCNAARCRGEGVQGERASSPFPLPAGGKPTPKKSSSSSSSSTLRVPRSERREALVLISKALFARLDLVSLCCGHRSPTGFSDISMRELMSLTGLSQRRCERAIALLKQAGFVEVSQPRERNNQGRYYGLRAIRVVTDFFFACLGLDRVLKKEKAKAQKRLESLGWHKARFGNWKKFFRKNAFGDQRERAMFGMNLPPAAQGKGCSPSPWESSPRQELSPCTRNESMKQPETWNAQALNSRVGECTGTVFSTNHRACTETYATHSSLMGGAGGIISPARRRQINLAEGETLTQQKTLAFTLSPQQLKRWNQVLNQAFIQAPDISMRDALRLANQALGLPPGFEPGK